MHSGLLDAFAAYRLAGRYSARELEIYGERLREVRGVSCIRRWLRDIPLVPKDGKLSLIMHVAIGVGIGVAGWLLYLAALVQQGA